MKCVCNLNASRPAFLRLILAVTAAASTNAVPPVHAPKATARLVEILAICFNAVSERSSVSADLAVDCCGGGSDTGCDATCSAPRKGLPSGGGLLWSTLRRLCSHSESGSNRGIGTTGESLKSVGKSGKFGSWSVPARRCSSSHSHLLA